MEDQREGLKWGWYFKHAQHLQANVVTPAEMKIHLVRYGSLWTTMNTYGRLPKYCNVKKTELKLQPTCSQALRQDPVALEQHVASGIREGKKLN
jgi:hypothetical protein